MDSDDMDSENRFHFRLYSKPHQWSAHVTRTGPCEETAEESPKCSLFFQSWGSAVRTGSRGPRLLLCTLNSPLSFSSGSAWRKRGGHMSALRMKCWLTPAATDHISPKTTLDSPDPSPDSGLGVQVMQRLLGGEAGRQKRLARGFSKSTERAFFLWTRCNFQIWDASRVSIVSGICKGQRALCQKNQKQFPVLFFLCPEMTSSVTSKYKLKSLSWLWHQC